MGMQMSEAAKSALINHPSARQGSVVVEITQQTKDELLDLGLVGLDAGLTRKGTIARERVMRAAEDAAFGA